MITSSRIFFNKLFPILSLVFISFVGCTPEIWDKIEGYIPYANLEVRYGFVNESGDWVIEPIYLSARDFSNGFAFIHHNGKGFYINERNEILGKAYFDSGEDFNLFGAPVHEAGYAGYISDGGAYIIKPKYIRAYPIVNGFALVNEYGGSDYSYINLNSQESIINFSHIGDIDINFASGDSSLLPYFCEDGKWGFINEIGELILPCEHDAVRIFSEGKAGVAKTQNSGDLLWNYIDTKGKRISSYEYSLVSDYKYGLTSVMKMKNNSETYYLLDDKGKKVTNKEYVIEPEIGSEYTFVMENWDEGYYIGPNKTVVKAVGKKITHGCPFQNGKFLIRTDESTDSDGQYWLSESGELSNFKIDTNKIPTDAKVYNVGCPSANGLILVGISFQPKLFDRNTFPLPKFSFL